ncbi:MAG TPA: ABC transporter permease [Gemmatimonadaceae bacterium]|jgi:putative ABC transport system permease protein
MKWPWEARREADDRALDDEIRAHFAMAVADRVARGESPDDAAAAVRREFGNVGHVKEVTHETWGWLWLERLTHDVRYALRSLRRAPIFAVVAILTLALGIGANTAMFTVVRGILLRPLPFHDPGALFLVSHAPDRLRSIVGPSMTDKEYTRYRSLTSQFVSTSTYNRYPATLLGAGEPLRVATASVSANFFATLGVRAQLGRVFRAAEEQLGANAVVVIGNRLWRDRFAGDPTVIGRSISLEGYTKTIVGVMPPGFEFPQHTEIWTPLVIQLSSTNSRFQPVIARLAPNATVGEAFGELRTFAANEERADARHNDEHFTAAIMPLRDGIVGDVRASLYIFAGAVGLVLLIACANVSNLMLMRAATRTHELGIRAALGASRSRLLRQLLTESVIVSLAGGVIGLVIAYGGVALLLAAAPPDLLPRTKEIHVDLVVLLGAFLTCIITGVISGAAPAITASRRDVRDALSETGRMTTRIPLHAVFVTAETALALVLLIGAGLLVRSFERLRGVDLGFVPDNVITVTLDFPDTRYKTAALLHDVQRRLSERVAAIDGVRESAAVNWIPLSQTTIMGDFSLDDGRSLPPGYMVLKPCVTAGYFAAMGIPIRQGRGFLASDGPGTERVAIVSQGVAHRLWPNASPIGKRLTMQDKPTPGDWMTIVGVVDDVAQEGLAQVRAEAIYQLLPQVDQPFFINHLNMVVRTDAAHSALVAKALRVAVREVDPEQPIESIMTMTSRISGVVAEPRFRTLLLGVFSLIALSLAAIGIYGVLAYGVTARTRELGIRIALGATAGGVIRVVLVGSALLVLPGLAIGLGTSLIATRVLRTFLFQVQPSDALTYVSATLLLLVVGLCAAYVPSRRAGRIDPLITMK